MSLLTKWWMYGISSKSYKSSCGVVVGSGCFFRVPISLLSSNSNINSSSSDVPAAIADSPSSSEKSMRFWLVAAVFWCLLSHLARANPQEVLLMVSYVARSEIVSRAFWRILRSSSYRLLFLLKSPLCRRFCPISSACSFSSRARSAVASA